jgi:hypothetical protein
LVSVTFAETSESYDNSIWGTAKMFCKGDASLYILLAKVPISPHDILYLWTTAILVGKVIYQLHFSSSVIGNLYILIKKIEISFIIDF